MSQGEGEEGGGNEVHLGLPCGRQKTSLVAWAFFVHLLNVKNQNTRARPINIKLNFFFTKVQY